jgi:hypothetical protein
VQNLQDVEENSEANASLNQDKINELAAYLEGFWGVFDPMFLRDDEYESLLEHTLESIRSKVSHNTSAQAVIMALGGNYDPALDKAHADEAEALLNLIRARKKVRDATIAVHSQKIDNRAKLSSLFGL